MVNKVTISKSEMLDCLNTNTNDSNRFKCGACSGNCPHVTEDNLCLACDAHMRNDDYIPDECLECAICYE